jgi:hypothetical protein
MLTARRIGTLRNRSSNPYQILLHLIKLLNTIFKAADDVPAHTENYSPSLTISILISIDAWPDDLSSLLHSLGLNHPPVILEM